MITIPRFLRPHEIILLRNNGEDDNGRAIIDEIFVKYVKVDSTYGIKQNKSSNSTDDKILIIIDLSDFVAFKSNEMVSFEDVALQIDQELIVNRESYTVTSISVIDPLGSTNFIEVTAK